MLSLPCTAYDRILLCLFLVFLTLFWPFLSFQIHPRENNLSGSYVRRAEHFAKGVDAAEKAAPGIKQEILTGNIKPTEKAVAAIAKAPPEERPALVQQLRQAKETEKQE